MSGSKRFNADTYFEGNRKKCKNNARPIRAHCDKETEKQSMNGKEDKCLDESLSGLSDFHSPSTCNQSSPGSQSSVKTSNSSLISTYSRAPSNKVLDSFKDKSIYENFQCRPSIDHESPISFTTERSTNLSYASSSSHTPVSPISNASIFDNTNTPSCSFESDSGGDSSPVKIRGRFHSSSPSLVQPAEHSMSIVYGEICDVSPQVTPSDANKKVFISKQSMPLQEDSSLREFATLDEFITDQEEGVIASPEPNSEEITDSELDEELPIEDIDKMLDDGLPENLKSSRNKEGPIKFRQKILLEERGRNHFDLLPEGWIKIMHASGMPVYLNRKSRVCTMARPYYLGHGSSRKHNVPLTGVPCLHYQRASKLEKKNKEEIEKKKKSLNKQSEIELLSAEIETLEENEASQSLEPSELHEYCKKAFKFKTTNPVEFKSWADRQKYTKKRNYIKNKLRPTLPKGTTLLKCPIQNPDGTTSETRGGEFIINPNGKSYVCILHEYVQISLKKHPKYEYKEVENSATPYSATVFIENIKYGFGIGVSKRQAKIEAAKAALEVLIPGISNKIESNNKFGMNSKSAKELNDTEISIFDQIKVEDPRVAEFCAKSTEPPPYAILLTCLGRNTGNNLDIELKYKMSPNSHQPDEYIMKVCNHQATVPCRNKREGKQRAAQAILKKLHPNITYWGSFLRMYGNRSIEAIREKKRGEHEINQLQNKAQINQPNFAVLNKLKADLLKLKEKREAVKATGTFILPDNIILPSLSSTDLNKVNL